jgi:cardiolipin synthase A/B
MWIFSDPLLSAAIIVVAALTALRAITTARTPQGAIGWVLIIAAVPALGLPLYLIFGLVDHSRTVAAQRAAETAPDGRATALLPCGAGQRLGIFETLAARRASRGNGADLLIDGDATYAAFHEAIAAARHYLLVQFYIVRHDASGRRLKDALIAKAREGVSVFLLHDAVWGVGLPRRFVRELEAAGIQVRAPRGPRRALGRFQINFRSHRKLLIADGKVAFTGGFNIGDEYLGLHPRYGPWRDTQLRLTGPIIARLQQDFAVDWRRASGTRLPVELDSGTGTDPRDMCGLIVAPAPTSRIETGNLYFCALAQSARRRLWIATPYFVPDTEVLSALKVAALRGVEVRILVPDRPDHYLPWLAAFTYFDDLRHAGGQIWRYQAGFMHQKVALVDDEVASVGTINLDIRSGILNFEHTAVIEDRAFAREVEAMLAADFARSSLMETELSQRPRWLRMAAAGARLLAPLL